MAERLVFNKDLVFLDVGQGDAIHLKTPEGHHVLIDSGGQTDYDVGTKILSKQNLLSFPVNNLSLLIHHIVILEHIFTNAEVSTLYSLLGIFDGLRKHTGFYHIIFSQAQACDDALDSISSKQPH